MKLTIDPEFESKISPISQKEFHQLEENILADGRIISPIIVWNGVIVDGHNRYRIIEKYPHIPYTTSEMDFQDRYEVIAWICKNQLGRRNLTPEQKKYLIGKQYAAEKSSHGASGFQGNQHIQVVSGQNVHSPQKTSERIAEENGVNEKYVRRAEHYARGIDLAEEVEPGLRQKLLSGTIKATDAAVTAVGWAEPEERQALVEELKQPKKESAKKTLSQIQQISEDLLTAKGRRTEEDMLYELEDALDSMMFRWTMCIQQNQDYFEKSTCRSQIYQLVHTGLEYLNHIEKGELPT